ncbi:hypothetical protein PCL_08912 [Purpureocillium lilacinum]|uniref:Uncharacterized protein n=1 Tax=Purpureocillium lilacinum TaxID=33203 RepID=A0A2U3EGJ0_PURLI|nr:hypothetical protein PCL_08912 [Purpureocillium lilacinum]
MNTDASRGVQQLRSCAARPAQSHKAATPGQFIPHSTSTRLVSWTPWDIHGGFASPFGGPGKVPTFIPDCGSPITPGDGKATLNWDRDRLSPGMDVDRRRMLEVRLCMGARPASVDFAESLSAQVVADE